jgi:TIR domain-containing protein
MNLTWETQFSQEEAELAVYYFIAQAGAHLSRQTSVKELMDHTGGTSRDMLAAIARLYLRDAVDLGVRLPPDMLIVTSFIANSEFTITITRQGCSYFTELQDMVERRVMANESPTVLGGKIDSHTENSRLLRVFLCHASTDRFIVKVLYQRLLGSRINAWFDGRKLLPGYRWKSKIDSALRESDAVIICLSKSSVEREGFVQKEIRRALELSEEKPDHVVFLVPVRLEECQMPDSLAHLHCVDLFRPEGYRMIIQALIERARNVGVTLPERF